MADKKKLRKILKGLKQQHLTHLADYSERVMQQLMKHSRFYSARTVMLYHALPDEVDTQIILQGFHERKKLLLPVVDGDTMYPVCYAGADGLCIGAFDIREPQGKPFTELSTIDLVVVPGVAFDVAGHRLGRGKGYYDRFLAQPELSNAYKIGICFPFQMLEEVPTDIHDVCMNEVLCGE